MNKLQLSETPITNMKLLCPKARNECILSALSGGFSFVKYRILTSQTLITAWLFVIYLGTEYQE